MRRLANWLRLKVPEMVIGLVLLGLCYLCVYGLMNEAEPVRAEFCVQSHDYTVVKAIGYREITVTTEKLLYNGYVPVGGVAIDADGNFYQAMWLNQSTCEDRVRK